MTTQLPGDVTPDNMEAALQQAVEIEIATIPVYLYTYYSLNRVPDQDAIKAFLLQRLQAVGDESDAIGELAAKLDTSDLDEIAQLLSAWIMVFANKAGALIVSVVMEEMLHMALSSNVKQAIVGPPDLLNKSPEGWPVQLPGHTPAFDINLAKFSLDQLYTFMEIESPHPLGKVTAEAGEAIDYTTIGEFYGLIEEAIKQYYRDYDSYDTSAAQLVPGRGYYAQNNINTNYYDLFHRPTFVNAEDSGDLIRVVDMDSALAALEEIVEQGEGNTGGSAFGPGDEVECGAFDSPGDFDDPDLAELAHFDKFNLLYCEYQFLQWAFGLIGVDVGSLFVHPFPENPQTTDYPPAIQDMSNLLNAVYSYLYIMTQACYAHQDDTQYEIFMFGIHKSMMWILGSLCETIRNSKYEKDGVTYAAAPTFENWPFEQGTPPKQQIIALYEKAAKSNSGLDNIGIRIHSLPDVPVQAGEPILS